ncbi:MAG: hypothetical protein M0006_00755 [Magnetospirillum sp.]|nr:hypothetical protein [Magnetospirillum sp.]
MEPGDVVVDASDVTALAFPLNWPGQPAPQPADEPKNPSKRSRRGRNRLAALLVPRALRRRFTARGGQLLAGWPVALSVPSPESGRFRLPSVKLTGRPLD